jgi:hypothetical protein
MSYLKNKLAPRVGHFEHDFNDGEGPVKVYVRPLTFKRRAELVTKRVAESGGSLYGSTPEKGLYLDAEMLADTLCDENGRAIARVDEILDWDGGVVYDLARKVFAREFPDIGKKAEENPSPAAN